MSIDETYESDLKILKQYESLIIKRIHKIKKICPLCKSKCESANADYINRKFLVCTNNKCKNRSISSNLDENYESKIIYKKKN